jgi:DMSO reductase family type II enzyme chaperone
MGSVEASEDLRVQQGFDRSQCYRLISAAFSFPKREELELIREGVLHENLHEYLSIAAPQLLDMGIWVGLKDCGDDDALQIEYTRLFEAGTGSLCPLNSGKYVEYRMRQMEELVRFYNHFGLSMRESDREMPDHLLTQLEFLHYLSYCEAQMLKEGELAGDIQRGMRDFIRRNLVTWLEQLHEKLAESEACAFYRDIVSLLRALLQSELERLTSIVGEADTDTNTELLSFVDTRQ